MNCSSRVTVIAYSSVLWCRNKTANMLPQLTSIGVDFQCQASMYLWVCMCVRWAGFYLGFPRWFLSLQNTKSKVFLQDILSLEVVGHCLLNVFWPPGLVMYIYSISVAVEAELLTRLWTALWTHHRCIATLNITSHSASVIQVPCPRS